jgi:hypothetical protein
MRQIAPPIHIEGRNDIVFPVKAPDSKTFFIPAQNDGTLLLDRMRRSEAEDFARNMGYSSQDARQVANTGAALALFEMARAPTEQDSALLFIRALAREVMTNPRKAVLRIQSVNPDAFVQTSDSFFSQRENETGLSAVVNKVLKRGKEKIVVGHAGVHDIRMGTHGGGFSAELEVEPAERNCWVEITMYEKGLLGRKKETQKIVEFMPESSAYVLLRYANNSNGLMMVNIKPFG